MHSILYERKGRYHHVKHRLFTITILVFCLLLAPSFSFAATSSTYDEYAESLSNLGVFVGTGNGFELDRQPTRIEGLVMLIRLLGAEEDALEMQNDSIPFTDVPNWAKGYVAYAYENGLTTGINSTTFGSKITMDAKAYLTFLLRSLGYNDQAGDFTYKNALTFAKDIDLISDKTYTTLSNQTFLRAHIAKTSYDALNFPYKGSSLALIDKLVSEQKVEKATAAQFKKLSLGEPAELSIQASGAVSLEENLKSVVMLTCYTDDSDYYGPVIGSGVILSADGKIITNYHVIEGAKSIEVTFSDESTYTSTVVIEDYDEELDLAVIKINKTGLTSAVIGDNSSLKTGNSIRTIGSPYGYLNTVTEGIVSALRTDSIQISAAINPGNSGGGLFDSSGHLIGITTQKLYLADNMGFAIPITYLTDVSDNKNISMANFYSLFSEPLPAAPTGLTVLYETESTVFLKWNEVSGADYYNVYYSTPDDDYYHYLDSIYEITPYGYMDYLLEPGQEYEYVVTTEKDYIESDYSTPLTFRKSYTNYRHGNFNLFYTDYPDIPDIGKLLNITYSKSGNVYTYRLAIEDEYNDYAFDDYEYLLDSFGFVGTESTSNTSTKNSVETITGTNIYYNATTDQTISISLQYSYGDDSDMMITVTID